MQRLEHAGYLRRRTDPSDRRATLVEPTPAGNALRSRVEGLWGRLERVVDGGLSAQERDEALRLVTRLGDVVLAQLDAAAQDTLTEV